MTYEEAKMQIQAIPEKIWDQLSEPDREAMEMVFSAFEAQEWIPVDKKSHPDTPVRVQVQLDNGWIITAYYQEDEWLSVPDFGEPIQDRWIEAWKPMTEPYKEDT